MIHDRLDILWARGGLAEPKRALELRALIDNGDFDDYWRFRLAHEQQRIHDF